MASNHCELMRKNELFICINPTFSIFSVLPISRNRKKVHFYRIHFFIVSIHRRKPKCEKMSVNLNMLVFRNLHRMGQVTNAHVGNITGCCIALRGIRFLTRSNELSAEWRRAILATDIDMSEDLCVVKRINIPEQTLKCSEI